MHSADYADYTARPRPQPNVTLAAEEPNVYRSNYESKTCAPAERDVSGNGTRHRLTFRSSGARRNLLEVTRSINIRSLRDEGNRLENLVKKQEVRPLYYTATTATVLISMADYFLASFLRAAGFAFL